MRRRTFLGEIVDQMAAQANKNYGRGLDLGKPGIQVCYDMESGDGWAELARCGAELMAWSNSPGLAVGEMVRSIGVLELEEEMARVHQFYRAAEGRLNAGLEE